jgi:hypothetical protein
VQQPLGYEDSVYRFYHQSFKVYGLQGSTQSIVQRLQALAPDRPLNPWFVQIVQAGTGKVFKREDNERWTEATRPILEAFFHARFSLEMAVRYADLQEPPQVLPSGYAALLYLFNDGPLQPEADRRLGTTDRRSRRQTIVSVRRTVAAGGRPSSRYDGPSPPEADRRLGTTDRRSRRQTVVSIRRTVVAGGRPPSRYGGPSSLEADRRSGTMDRRLSL